MTHKIDFKLASSGVVEDALCERIEEIRRSRTGFVPTKVHHPPHGFEHSPVLQGRHLAFGLPI